MITTKRNCLKLNKVASPKVTPLFPQSSPKIISKNYYPHLVSSYRRPTIFQSDPKKLTSNSIGLRSSGLNVGKSTLTMPIRQKGQNMPHTKKRTINIKTLIDQTKKGIKGTITTSTNLWRRIYIQGLTYRIPERPVGKGGALCINN